MAQGRLQEIADGDSRETVLCPACFQADEVLLDQVNLCSVLDDQGAFFGRNEFSEDREERRFSSSCAATDEDIFSSKNIVFEAIRDGAVESPCRDQVLHLKMASVELTDREGHASQTAGRDDRGDTAPVRESRGENS